MRQLDYWKSKQKQQQLEEQISKNQAQNEVEVIIQILVKQFAVKKIILFGSLVRGKFNKNSDIDLAVEGVPKRDYFTAVAIANSVTSRWVDLKPLEDLEPHFRERVLATGECVYEADISQSSTRTGDGY